MSKQGTAVLILDCGATNVRAMVINTDGSIVASHHIANQTQVDPQSGFHQWDTESIWHKFCDCTQQLRQQNALDDIAGIAVTTFGVDGAPFSEQQEQLAPVISWKCPRTLDMLSKLDNYLDPASLYQRNGVGEFSFNTLYKLLWIKENQPELFNQMDKFLFISSIFTHRLTGKLTTDHSMAGTSMLTDIVTRDWCEVTLSALGLNRAHFPPLVEAGEYIGGLLSAPAEALGLPVGLPVIAAGHDTQFAVLGSGARHNQPVLSAGTWEILMARVECFSPPRIPPSATMTTEFDANKQWLNPGIQWLSSGVLEPLIDTYFPQLVGNKLRYQTVIDLASHVPPGANGTQVVPHFVPGEQPAWSIHKKEGDIAAPEVYRAALEAMAFKLKDSLKELEERAQFKTKQLLCVGGGSKNALWNQIRADVLNLPIKVIEAAETTAIGAAMTVFYGLGIFPSLSAAQQKMAPTQTIVMPSRDMLFYQENRAIEPTC
ncbi:L-fuculokinase [Vibrio sp. DNB22_10_4]